MIALLTGASGFIGSHLVERLLDRGASVRALIRSETPASALDPRVQYARVDLEDVRSVREAPVWDGITHLFHVAGVTKRRTLAQFRDGNVAPTANLLSATAAHFDRSPPRIVLVSSQAAAGPARSAAAPVRDDDPPAPVEAYGQSKLEAELAARLYDGRLPISIVRPSSVYGPRDRDFLRLFKQAVRPIAIHAAPRHNLISIAHVHDVVSAIILAAEHPAAAGRTYFVANERPTSWGELYDEIARAASVARTVELQLPGLALTLAGLAGDAVSALSGLHLIANGNKTRLARPRWWICDSSRARAELGWTSAYSLQQGVRDTYLWYLNAGWMRAPHPRAGAVPPQEAKP